MLISRSDFISTHISQRPLFFLAACLFFDSEIDLQIAFKMRPFGGLIGLIISRIDSILKYSKVLRLHPALPDAAVFIKDFKK